VERLLRNRRREIAAGAVALLVALAVVLALAGGTDEEADDPAPRDTATTTERPPARTETGPRTAPAEEPGRERAAGIARTVTLLVQAREETDAPALCELVGQESRGTGPAAVEACARAAGVELAALPTSDELSIESARASGERGVARLAGGATVRLRRVAGRWRVTAVEAAGSAGP
jgi:ferric-dicitrate binding protein FerR (iron transport regulator)